MGNREEQEFELEALRTIFEDDLIEKKLKKKENIQFQIKIKNENHQNNTNLTDECLLHITLSDDYPYAIPTIDIISDEISEAQKERMQNVLIKEAESNLGTPMIFTLIAIIQDWWHTDNEHMIKKDSEEILRKETERYKRIDGTPVSVESFLLWKKAYDEERLSKKKTDVDEEQEKRLSGKQIFEKNSMMNISDQMFLEDDSEFVDETGDTPGAIDDDIDESLFENIDEEIENMNIV